MNFLEAIVARQAIDFDQNDEAYLQQFPKHFWTNAFFQRYNSLLLEAIGQDGNVRPEWQDVRDMQVMTSGGKKFTFAKIRTGIIRLINKIKKLGFDLSDPDPATATTASFSMMSWKTAVKMVTAAKSAAGAQLQSRKFVGYRADGSLRTFEVANPQIQMAGMKWMPNKAERSINSIDDVSASKDKWNQIKDKAMPLIERLVSNFLVRLARPENIYHLNYYYWQERRNELVENCKKRLFELFNDPRFDEPNFMTQVINNYLSSVIQTGLVGRRALEKAKANNINISDLLRQGYTPQQIASYLKGDQLGRPVKTINPLQGILNSAAPEDAAIHRYRQGTIDSRRQKATAMNMQRIKAGEPIASRGDPYRIKETFHDWLEKKGLN